MKVADCMSRNPLTAHPSMTASEAWYKLKTSVLHVLPVVDDTGLIGIIKLQELEEFAQKRSSYHAPEFLVGEYLLEGLLVGDVMRAPTTTVHPTDSLETAAQEMLRHKVLGLPVVEDHWRLVGVITVSDLLEVFATHRFLSLPG